VLKVYHYFYDRSSSSALTLLSLANVGLTFICFMGFCATRLVSLTHAEGNHHFRLSVVAAGQPTSMFRFVAGLRNRSFWILPLEKG